MLSSRPLDKGGARSPKNFFRPFGPQFGLRIRGGGQAPPLNLLLQDDQRRSLTCKKNGLGGEHGLHFRLGEKSNALEFQRLLEIVCFIVSVVVGKLRSLFFLSEQFARILIKLIILFYSCLRIKSS